ncbi:BgTH12-01716 [Blumeria graminis f. sp. triticale]|nr:BgTH12-01716 [Blumeria graminis f. sp. triticale]
MRVLRPEERVNSRFELRSNMPSNVGPIAKPRAKVTPLLRKWTQSDENTLDLDHPTELQDVLKMYDFGKGSRAPHDACISPTRQVFHHRSTSGTSQFSTTTAGSGQRTGSFVHPFQQTPRPYTPPIIAAYQESLYPCERANTVNDDEIDPQQRSFRLPISYPARRSHSLAAASSSPLTQQPPIQKKLSSSRLAVASSYSSLRNQSKATDLTSTSDSLSYSSGCATERGFRLRSRSEVISRSRAQSIQEARRKFQEKESVKEEKAAREEIKQLEKRQQKEAIKMDRSHRQSITSDATRSKRSRSDLTSPEKGEAFMGRADGEMLPEQLFISEEPLESQCNCSNAKQRTHSAWAKFLMWFRIRLLRISRKASKR